MDGRNMHQWIKLGAANNLVASSVGVCDNTNLLASPPQYFPVPYSHAVERVYQRTSLT
jgi:hypothetical protein